MRITLLSINVWDLPIALPGTRGRLRRSRILTHVPAISADLVLLQEAFRPRLRRAIARAMAAYHADPGFGGARWFGPFRMDRSGGLATFSRWPVIASRHEPSFGVRRMKPDERIGRKGTLWSVIETPAGPLTVGNVHLYAGNRPVDARVRTVQARRIARTAGRHPGPVVLAGDFNIARESEQPDRGPTSFDVLEDAGFREVADGQSAGIETMDPRRNRWARYAPWHRPARRLTQVFLRGAALRVAEPPKLVLDDPPVSDHFGLLVTLECCSD